jgi:NAD(P)-dependent dehydrogenase (short-subunit alcohol dehydrogenase family)
LSYSHQRRPNKLAWKKAAVAAIYPDLAGKVVLVTAGASGIGSAIVRGLARQKSTVVFFDTKDEAGIGLSRELSGQRLAAYFQHVDLTDIAARAEVRVLFGLVSAVFGLPARLPQPPSVAASIIARDGCSSS